MADDKMLDKIRKLLAQAEGAGTEAEAETFNAKARELVARYGIDQALLAASGEKKEAIHRRRITMDQPYSRDKANLLGWIAVPLRCRTVLHGLSGGTVQSVSVVGFESDVDRVELLYTSLLLQATTQIVKVRPEWWMNESVAAYRRSWLQGFGYAVHQRLKAAEQHAADESELAGEQAAGKSTALVLVDRNTQVERAVKQLFPNTTKARKTSRSGSGSRSGYRAGQRANLGGTGVTGATRAAVGGSR